MIKIWKSLGTVASSVAVTTYVSPSGVDSGASLSPVVASVSIASPLDPEESYTTKVYTTIRGVVNCSHDPHMAVLLTGQASV